jgi:hypothetical protein
VRNRCELKNSRSSDPLGLYLTEFRSFILLKAIRTRVQKITFFKTSFHISSDMSKMSATVIPKADTKERKTVVFIECYQMRVKIFKPDGGGRFLASVAIDIQILPGTGSLDNLF